MVLHCNAKLPDQCCLCIFGPNSVGPSLPFAGVQIGFNCLADSRLHTIHTTSVRNFQVNDSVVVFCYYVCSL